MLRRLTNYRSPIVSLFAPLISAATISGSPALAQSEASPEWLDATLQLAAKDASIAPVADFRAPEAPAAAGNDPRWRFRLEYFQGTGKDIGNVLLGNAQPIAQNGFGVGAGYVFARDCFGLPLDLIVQGTVMWHEEKGWQDNFLQYTASLRAEWTSFPWNSHLRTRLGFASGWSYVDKIPYAEVLTRNSSSSQHFLHYLEPSLSLNSGDLFRLAQLDHVFNGFDSSRLDNAWVVARILHRSGAWGLYGEDNNGAEITTGSNYLSLGLEFDF